MDTLISRFFYLEKTGVSLEGRGLMNQEALLMAKDHLFGIGLGNYSAYTIARYSEDCGYTLGIDDDILSSGLNIYPNPVYNSLTIDSQTPVEKVEVYTILGQKVIEKSSDLGSVSTETLSKGIYMLKILSEKGSTTRRLIKQ